MKKFKYISLLAFFAVLAAPPAQAGWLYDKSDSDHQPYLMNHKQEQKAQWRREHWSVEDWAPTAQKGEEQVDAFFRARILVDYQKGNWMSGPTLVVGQEFYHLSGYDQRRVLDLFNHTYQVTTQQSRKTLSLRDGYTGRIIGIYTQYGLQLS